MAALVWRLARAPLAEAGLYADDFGESPLSEAGLRLTPAEGLDRMGERRVRALRRGLRFATDLQGNHGLTLSRLVRYEAHLERSLTRTMDLFARLRASRPPPEPEVEAGREQAVRDAALGKVVRAVLARRPAAEPEEGPEPESDPDRAGTGDPADGKPKE